METTTLTITLTENEVFELQAALVGRLGFINDCINKNKKRAEFESYKQDFIGLTKKLNAIPDTGFIS